MDNIRQGIILKGVGGFYDVLDTAAGLVYTCKARASIVNREEHRPSRETV